MTMEEKILSLSSLTGCHSMLDHVCSIVLGGGTGQNVYVDGSYRTKYITPPTMSVKYIKPEIKKVSYIQPPTIKVRYIEPKKNKVKYIEPPKIKINFKC